MEKVKKKIVFPDTLIVVAIVVLIVAILSWVIPSGTYEYREQDT